MSIARIALRLSGRVQGVFFRVTARAEAERLGITGFVENQRDGTVRIVAEGKHEGLEQFLSWCTTGVRFASVRNVAVQWHPATGEFTAFTIRVVSET